MVSWRYYWSNLFQWFQSGRVPSSALVPSSQSNPLRWFVNRLLQHYSCLSFLPFLAIAIYCFIYDILCNITFALLSCLSCQYYSSFANCEPYNITVLATCSNRHQLFLPTLPDSNCSVGNPLTPIKSDDLEPLMLKQLFVKAMQWSDLWNIGCWICN